MSGIDPRQAEFERRDAELEGVAQAQLAEEGVISAETVRQQGRAEHDRRSAHRSALAKKRGKPIVKGKKTRHVKGKKKKDMHRH